VLPDYSSYYLIKLITIRVLVFLDTVYTCTFVKSVMVSVAIISKFGYRGLPTSCLLKLRVETKINGQYYRHVLLMQKLLPVIRSIFGYVFVFQQYKTIHYGGDVRGFNDGIRPPKFSPNRSIDRRVIAFPTFSSMTAVRHLELEFCHSGQPTMSPMRFDYPVKIWCWSSLRRRRNCDFMILPVCLENS